MLITRARAGFFRSRDEIGGQVATSAKIGGASNTNLFDVSKPRSSQHVFRRRLCLARKKKKKKHFRTWKRINVCVETKLRARKPFYDSTSGICLRFKRDIAWLSRVLQYRNTQLCRNRLDKLENGAIYFQMPWLPRKIMHSHTNARYRFLLNLLFADIATIRAF